MDPAAKARKDEIAAKRAKLAELKRQRELRTQEVDASRQQAAEAAQLVAPRPSRADHRRELDSLISNLVGNRSSSTDPRDTSSPAPGRASRPISVVSGGENVDPSTPPTQAHPPAVVEQTLSIAPLTILYEAPADSQPETVTYNRAVQTSEPWEPQRDRSLDSDDDYGLTPSKKTPRASKRLSRRERERDEELRQNIRKEVEEELKAARQLPADDSTAITTAAHESFSARILTDEERNAEESSADYLAFIERSTKVAERELDEQFDVLKDYAVKSLEDAEDEGDEAGAARGKKGRRVREVAQFFDERWCSKRCVSDIAFSPKFPELTLASYTRNNSAPHDPDGLIQVWNMHMHNRPEYTFTSQSDILTAKFSPFHPNYIIGGCYNGQVMVWDTRDRSTARGPVQKTPLTSSGHTHPVYSLDIVGTQNANNIISCSTDGVVCSWSIGMLTQPQEYLELTTPPPAKTEDMAPTCIAFPKSDPTYFLAGTEEGTIYPCHRYDRAGAKAGVDARLSYRGHAAPIMSLDFHPTRGPIDLGDLVLSSSMDWGVRLWKSRPPAANAANSVSGPQTVTSLIEFVREDVVYDARWSPVKPGVFALVDGGGGVEFWDLNRDVEVPVARAVPSDRGPLKRSLNKVAWEPQEGRRTAVGGLDGVVTVFEVGAELGGLEGVRSEEWTGVKRLVGRLEGAVNGR
ncbi:hypothetical protein H2201_000799 [Coniosporium apollinis]|uniref:Dynein intermediate chain, cytosolic n=1 Tax=Coniosporium apollinis TaxID=61459 RepID=A0ABQ9P4G0_9PEZI|nr:hypothetical protein H2201_000799 [Coniosporium apollinis]